MPKDQVEKLNKLLELVQNDTVTPKEIEQFLLLVLGFINKAKDEFGSLSQANLQVIKDSIAYIEDNHKELVASVNDKVDSKVASLINDIKSNSKTLETSINEVKSLLKEVQAIEVKDGKDADEEKIIAEVLALIPEHKEVILDGGEEIVAKINELPTTEDAYKIDASHIKNLPTGRSVGGSTARNLYQLQDISLTDLQDNDVLVYNATTGLWENGVGGGGGSTTPTNGLQTISTSIGLGGTLTQDTTITGGLFDFTLSSDNISLLATNSAQMSGQTASISATTGLRIRTPNINDATATTGQFLQLSDDITGNAEWVDLPATTWGSITGTLSSQTDLQNELNDKEDVSNKSTTTTLGTSDTLYPTQNAVKTYVDNALGIQSINEQTGTTYTFVLTDTGKLVTGSNASSITFTVPPNSSVAFAVGTHIDITQTGAGVLSIAAGAGVTINSQDSNLKIFARYVSATLIKTATDTWLLVGNLRA